MALDLALAPAQGTDDAEGQELTGPQIQPLPRIYVPKAECREHVAEEVALILRRALVHGVYRRSENGLLHPDALREAVVFRYRLLRGHGQRDALFPEDLIDQPKRFFGLGEPDIRSALVHRFLDFLRLRPGLQGRAHMRGEAVQGLARRQDDQHDQLLHFGVERSVPRDFAPNEAIPHLGKIRIGRLQRGSDVSEALQLFPFG